MTPIEPSARPLLARGLRLQWEPAQQAHVLLYPEGMIKLNGSAAAIMTRCDGSRTVAQLIAELEREFGAANLASDVEQFLQMARQKAWLELAP